MNPDHSPGRGLAIAAGLLLSSVLAACGASSDVQRGHFSYGFETVSFQPCNSDEQWWVTGVGDATQALIDQYEEVAQAEYEAVYVELQGEVSAAGAYGHLGAYQREFAVSEVVEVRAASDEDCT
jgi:putative lipoprotein